MKKKVETKPRPSTKIVAAPFLRNKNGLIKNEKRSGNADLKNRPSTPTGSDCLSRLRSFPILVMVLSFVTCALRMHYVMDRSNWVAIHPDEVFQSMEVAHTEFYGYGFRPYEFSSYFNDSASNTNASLTQYRQMELEAGLSAMRSPIYPCYYVIVAQVAWCLGVKANPYLMFRIGHVLITSLLPLSVYAYCVATFHSTDVASIAAIFITSSIHLHVLGTHCFLQSFLSPFIFLSLGLVASIAKGSEENDSLTAKDVITDDDVVGVVNSNRIGHGDHVQKKCEEDCGASSGPDLNSSKSKSKSCWVETQNINFVKKWDYDKGVFVTKLVFPLTSKGVIVGFLTGITSYIRPEAALIHFVNVCFLVTTSTKYMKSILSKAPMIVVGLMISFILCVMIDTQFYGGFVITPWNWFVVNVLRNISTSVFGKMDVWFYFNTFYSHDFITCCFCISSVVLFTISMVIFIFRKIIMASRGNNVHTMIECDWLSVYTSTRLLIACVWLLGLYSYHGHKEIRFIHDTIVLVLVFSAFVFSTTLSLIDGDSIRKASKIVIGIAFTLIWGYQWHQFYDTSSSTQWTYHHAPDTQDTNVCLEFISEQPDVSGVFIEDNIFLTGGMTILHKDVPIFSKGMNGFLEFDMDSRINVSSRVTAFCQKKELSVNTLTRVSNYVSQANAVGLMYNLLGKQEYNYLLLTKDQPFKKMGFQQVFEYGNRRVLKRVGDSASENQINYVLGRLSPGKDVMVLIQEGDVLLNMRQFEKAAQRFQHALKMSQEEDVVTAYLPLHECLKKMDRHEDAIVTMRRCVQRHGYDTCWSPRKVTRLDQQ